MEIVQPAGEQFTNIVTSVANTDGTLVIFPTTGDVIASLNLSHQNNWLTQQDFSTIITTPTIQAYTGGGLQLQDQSGNTIIDIDNANAGAATFGFSAPYFSFAFSVIFRHLFVPKNTPTTKAFITKIIYTPYYLIFTYPK